MSTEDQGSPQRPDWNAATARLAIGLAQGLAVYPLYSAADAKSWPATNGLIFAPLLVVFLFVPVILALGISNLRTRTLLTWAFAATIIVGGLAAWNIWHQLPNDCTHLIARRCTGAPNIVPSFGLFVFIMTGLFIAHALVAGSDADRALIARYSTHFDVAWKLAVQLVLAGVFTGIVRLLLLLGASLFALIGIQFFQRLIEHEWFAIPTTTLAAAGAVHLTDVRATLVRGTRTLVLVLFSWLLPLMTFIAAGFVGSLPFTGLKPLWETRHAAALLLTAAAVLIILVNAAYQDGDAERRPARLLRVAGSLAAWLLVPLTGLAGYAMYLRVAQYGWTADRVSVAVCLLVAGFYAAGYSAATLLSEAWLKRIERWNFFASLLVLACIVAIFSPVADPDRISVASQVSRLREGLIPPKKFDFAWLRWDSGRYGYDALHRLASSRDGFTRRAAIAQLGSASRYQSVTGEETTRRGAKAGANIAVYPSDRALPSTFLRHDWMNDSNKYEMPGCLVTNSATCDAYLIGLGAAGQEEIVIATRLLNYADVFDADGKGDWHLAGRIEHLPPCSAIRNALHAGHFTLAPALKQWKDIIVNGSRLSVVPFAATRPCP